MKVVRARNPLVFGLIMEHFITDESTAPEVLAEELAARLINNPDTTGVFVIIDGDEVKGFVTGWLVSNRTFFWFDQAWLDPHVPIAIRRELYDSLEDFAKDLGCTEIRAETHRNTEALKRNWGYSEYSKIVRKEI